jgi:hypothetical protein
MTLASTSLAFLLIAVLPVSALYAPFTHLHQDDGLHPDAAFLIHAHFPIAADPHGDHDDPFRVDSPEHGKSVDTFTVKASDFHHFVVNLGTAWAFIQQSEERLSRIAVLNHSHDPPLSKSGPPRSPPNPSL